MSDAAAPAAPVAAQPNQAEGEQPAQPQQPVDPFAEFDAVLKAKPVKYKAGGKERVVGSMKELVRKAEMADGMQSRQQELLEREQRAAAKEERDAKLKAAKSPRERVAVLREYAKETGVDFDELAEEAVLERIEREKSMAGMSEAEKAARREAEELRAQLAEYQSEKQRAEEETKQREEEAEFAELRNTLASHAVKALTAAKLPKEAAPDAVRRLSVLMAKAAENRLPLDPEELANEAVQWAGRDFQSYTTALEGEPLLAFLGDKVAQRASKALLARSQGAGGVRAKLPPVEQQAAKPIDKGQYTSTMAMWKALEQGKLK